MKNVPKGDCDLPSHLAQKARAEIYKVVIKAKENPNNTESDYLDATQVFFHSSVSAARAAWETRRSDWEAKNAMRKHLLDGGISPQTVAEIIQFITQES